MKREYRYALLAVIIIAVLGILAVSVPHTVLYSLENDLFPSRFHDNVDVLKIKSINSTTDIFPLLQELSDSSFPVSLNLRIRNVGEAKRYLDYFSRNNIRVKNLVVTLDMQNSDIQELSKNAALQQQLLDELMKSSVALDMLDNLEVQYRDAVNPELLMSIRYQREALLKKIHGIHDQYGKSTASIIAIDKKTGISTRSQESGLEEVTKVVQSVDRKYGTPGSSSTRPSPEINLPAHSGPQLSFILHPEAGVYGDTITCFGSLLTSVLDRADSSGDRPLALYLDNTILFSGKTDPSGTFSYDLKIDRIGNGTHSLYAQSGSTKSPVRKLSIEPVNSETRLLVDHGSNWSQVICSGNVTANRPVSGAPVQLVWDETNLVDTVTDATGSFSAKAVLPPGNHTIIALFSGAGYPITSSASEPGEILITRPLSILGENPKQDDLLAIIIIAASLLSLFLTGALFYLRRTGWHRVFSLPGFLERKRSEPVPDQAAVNPEELPEQAGELSDPPVPGNNTPGPSPVPEESLAVRFSRLLKAEGLSSAAHMAYHRITGRVADDLRIRRYQVMTPRELSQSCKGRSYCRTFSSFVAIYERIRYGGQQTTAVRVEFEKVMESAEIRMDGEDH